MDERRKAYGECGRVTFWKRKQRRVPPNVGRPRGNLFTGESGTDGIVIVGNFKGREAVFANRFRNVAPALVTLPTAQFVTHRSLRVEEAAARFDFVIGKFGNRAI